MPPVRTDPFEDALEDLRIGGTLLLHRVHGVPWGVDVPDGVELKQQMDLSGDALLIPFHLVLSGEMEVEIAGHEKFELTSGQAIICTRGLEHRLSQGRPNRILKFEDILAGKEISPGGSVQQGDTDLMCGTFVTRSVPLNPILSALPDYMIVGPGDANEQKLAQTVALLRLELDDSKGQGFTMSRLIEILFSEALRSHAAQRQEDGEAGWFKALGDSKVSQVLSIIHRAPGEPMSVASLADAVALSPSRLAARFREVTGQSVMNYVAGWRMNRACRELAETGRNLTEIATDAGYMDTASFSRAFKALVGKSPAQWRTAQVDASAASRI